MRKQTLKDFLLHETDAGTLAVVEDGGWVQGIVYIDHEDLSPTSLPERLLNREIKSVNYRDDYRLAKQIISCYVISIK